MRIQHMDVSHFRAPYKNGMMGFGADPVVTPGAPLPITPAPSQATPEGALVDVDAGGVRIFKPTVASAILSALSGAVIIVQGGDDSVSLVPATAGDPRETGAAWAKRKLSEGKVVLAGSNQGIPGVVMPLPPESGLQKFLQAAPASAVPQFAAPQASSGGASPLYAVLASPGSSTASMLGGGKTIYLLGAAAVVGVAGYLIFRKPRRSAS
ncbi:MAG: hypothetical protein LUO93_03015 [Methanomicrobiales archaeon]|nr:hypothetical protein [Methanomicrobiales archaeon]